MTSITHSLARNSLWQIGGKALATALGVAAIAIITRLLGPEQYGYYTTIIAYLTFFSIAVDLGLNVFIVQLLSERELDPAEERHIASVVFTLRMVSSLVILGLGVAVMMWLSYAAPVKVNTWIVALSLWAIVMQQILVGVFQTKLAMARVALAEVLGRVVLVGGVWLAARLGGGLTAVLWVGTIASVVSFFATWIWLNPFVSIRLRWDWALLQKIMQRSWPVALSVVFNLVYLRADILLLALYRTPAEVGLYGAAYRVIDILVMFPTMFVALVLPFLSRSFVAADRVGFQTMLQNAFDSLLIMVLPFVVGAWLLGEQVMVFVAGADFVSAGALLQILIIAAVFVYVSNLFGHTIVAVNRQRQMVWGYAFVAILTLAGYRWLIPSYGALAAAWLSVFSESMIMLIGAYFVLTASQVRLSPARAIRALVAVVGMGVVVWLVRPLGLWSALLAGAISYAIFLRLTKTVSKDLWRSILAS